MPDRATALIASSNFHASLHRPWLSPTSSTASTLRYLVVGVEPLGLLGDLGQTWIHLLASAVHDLLQAFKEREGFAILFKFNRGLESNCRGLVDVGNKGRVQLPYVQLRVFDGNGKAVNPRILNCEYERRFDDTTCRKKSSGDDRKAQVGKDFPGLGLHCLLTMFYSY